MNILAVETSCDETAVSVFDSAAWSSGTTDSSTFLLADFIASQSALHLPYGGVVPELAAREHLALLPKLVTTALDKAQLSPRDINAVAATRGPGLKGCLLVGLNFAKAFAYARGIPFIPVNHLEGHIWSAELLDRPMRPQAPFVSLVVSGGHTFLVKVNAFRNYELMASTRDDAAGEAFDKIATMIGLPYPGGPALSRLAEGGNASRFSLPVSLRADETSFSFSGLKTAASRRLSEIPPAERDEVLLRDFAASAQAAIVENLVAKSVSACTRAGVSALVLCGGVAANKRLQRELGNALTRVGVRLIVPPPQWCTDNAAMIAVVAAMELKELSQRYVEWNVSRQGIGVDVPFEIDALPRWPIDQVVSGDAHAS